MISFHNDPEIKTALIEQLERHAAADEIIKGVYWEGGKGCAVGCTVHSGRHADYETQYGIPQTLAYLEDCIFEGLPNELAKAWPLRFAHAVPVGVDLTRVGWRFLEWLLTDVQVNPGIHHELVRDSVARVAELMGRLGRGEEVAALSAAAAAAASRTARASASASASASAAEASAAASAAEASAAASWRAARAASWRAAAVAWAAAATAEASASAAESARAAAESARASAEAAAWSESARASAQAVRQAASAQAARLRFIKRCEGIGSSAIVEEETILGVGREYLPPCAIVVLDGGESSAEYYDWLCTQVREMHQERLDRADERAAP